MAPAPSAHLPGCGIGGLPLAALERRVDGRLEDVIRVVADRVHPPIPENFAAPVLPGSQLTPGLRSVAESASALISPQEAAQRLGVGRATIYNLCKRGLLPHVRVGSSVRLALSDIIAALAQLQRATQ